MVPFAAWLGVERILLDRLGWLLWVIAALVWSLEKMTVDGRIDDGLGVSGFFCPSSLHHSFLTLKPAWFSCSKTFIISGVEACRSILQ